MFALEKIKEERQLVATLADIVQTIKFSTIFKLNALQRMSLPADDFAKGLQRCLEILLATSALREYLDKWKSRQARAVVVVTPEEGFLGELNILLVNTALELVKESPQNSLWVIGRQGKNYLEEIKVPFQELKNVTDTLEDAVIEEVASRLGALYPKICSHLSVVYPRYESLVAQKIEVLDILPYQLKDDGLTLRLKGAESLLKNEDWLLVEPNVEIVFAGLIRFFLEVNLWEIFFSAKQAEYAARLMHLESSEQEITQQSQVLDRQYRKHLTNLNDKTIREIFASRVALERGRG